LVRASAQSGIRGPDDPAKIAERFFIDLVILEELRVIAKISKKPVEFPEGPLSAIQSPSEGSSFEGLGFQNAEPDFYEWLLWMPPVASPIHADEEQSFKLVFDSTLI